MNKIRNFNVFFTLSLLFFVAGNMKVLAQLSAIHDYSRIDSILLIGVQNDTLQYPFAGGLNSCQFGNIDINLDGIEDLLVFDRHGYRILPFLVSPMQPSKLLFDPGSAVLLPPLEQWMQTVDYNNDGKKDIFTYTTGGIKVYRNDSENSPVFTMVTDPFLLSLQGSTLTNILVTYADYPAITDIDKDGDIDILTFWGLGTFVEWHKNTSMELYGIPDSLTFEKESSCWGHFAEGIENNTIIQDTCAGVIKQSEEGNADDPKHTGSTLLVNDLNGDGLPDLTLGDVDFSTLIQLTNGGTLSDSRIVSQTTDFPNSVTAVDMNSFPAAMLADVNNDGLKDLLVSPFDPSLTKADNFTSISLYLDNGSVVQPDYQLSTESFLQEQMLDLGSGAYPVFFDYNSDGLMDLLVGNYGYQDTCIYQPETGLLCSFTAKIALLLNAGTLTNPEFRLVDRNIANLSELQMQSLIPTVADLDGDGDVDLLCGNSSGKLVYCENVALPGHDAEFKLTDAPWEGIDVGDFSAPQLFDMDGDGLYDLIIGKKNGTLSYYKNTGTKQMPIFSSITEMLGGVDVTNTQLSNNGFSIPCFYKNKQDEILLFSGSEFGDIYVYDQITNNLDGNFRYLGNLPYIKEGWRSGLTLGNLNNDTLSDMFVGNYAGGLGLFFGKPDKIFGIKEQTFNTLSSLQITPNPATNEILIDTKNDLFPESGFLLIRGTEGKILKQIPITDLPMRIDISEFGNGIYFVSLNSGKVMITGKLVICR